MKMREMNDWKISNDTLKLGVELGRGSFGIVMRAPARRPKLFRGGGALGRAFEARRAPLRSQGGGVAAHARGAKDPLRRRARGG